MVQSITLIDTRETLCVCGGDCHNAETIREKFDFLSIKNCRNSFVFHGPYLLYCVIYICHENCILCLILGNDMGSSGSTVKQLGET